MPAPTQDAGERDCIATVERHGWQVMLVGAGEAPTEPAFAYTVGLPHRAGHPELVMSGLAPELMHRVLNGVVGRLDAGRGLAAGDVIEGALSRVALVVEDLSAEGLAETVTWSRWFHRRPVDAVQLVWPDTSGRFAWQTGAPPILDERQPPSWRIPGARVGMVAEHPEWPFPVSADGLAFVCTHVLDDGKTVCFAAREADDGRGEDWSFHCGGDHGSAGDDVRLVHFEHVVRAAPSLTALADLALGERAWRQDADQPWSREGPGLATGASPGEA